MSTSPVGLHCAIPENHCAERVSSAIDAIQNGRAVVLVDHENRENEADVILSAELIDVPMMAMLIRHCSGIVCLCLDDTFVDRLKLAPMVVRNESRYGTAFTVSIEARHGVTTGVSAPDRVTTIRAAVNIDARPEDVVSPGHMFPLRAAPGGVLARRGHTEGAVDLVRLAGCRPAAVLCELMNPDGSMARGQEVLTFSQKYGFPILFIDDLVAYRLSLLSQRSAPESLLAE